MLLLVVDMQKGLFTDDTPRYDTDGVIRRINRLIEKFRQAKQPVIFIRHDGPKGDALEPETRGWEIIDALDRLPTDLIIGKRACDSFLDTSLLEAIRGLKENRLVITGCATDFCVDTTVRSAAAKGLETIVAADAHTTADRPHLDAKTIITHHNWSWKNLILPEGEIRVADTDELVKALF
ncbi:MAG: cysteine hydrolase [Desulfobacterales bacterium]|nr:cysteine hydrolase [Desulfobacterales bacterium]